MDGVAVDLIRRDIKVGEDARRARNSHIEVHACQRAVEADAAIDLVVAVDELTLRVPRHTNAISQAHRGSCWSTWIGSGAGSERIASNHT